MTLPTLSAQAWQSDLSFFAHALVNTHKNAYHLVSQTEFARAVSEFNDQIPSLPAYAIIVGFQRLTAMIGDGHTRIAVAQFYHVFPFKLFWFGRDLRVLSTTADYSKILGARVLKMGKRTLRDANRLVQAIIPQGENKWFVMNASQQRLVHAEPLAALGIIDEIEHAPWTFETEDGKRVTLDVPSFPSETPLDWIDLVAEKPLYLQNPDDPLFFAELSEQRIVYVNFRRYTDLEKNAARLYDFLNAHPPDTLVIDLRQNSGGDFTEGRQYLIYPVNFLFKNRFKQLYVIIGRATFSAGMTNATDFRRETDAILIGEPTGARPNGFQETGKFTLPNSGLQVTCSILHYRFQDREQPAVMPDIRIDPDWNAYRSGRDPVMDWITAHVKYGSQ